MEHRRFLPSGIGGKGIVAKNLSGLWDFIEQVFVKMSSKKIFSNFSEKGVDKNENDCYYKSVSKNHS
jgi:hypothetical protein